MANGFHPKTISIFIPDFYDFESKNCSSFYKYEIYQLKKTRQRSIQKLLKIWVENLIHEFRSIIINLELRIFFLCRTHNIGIVL